MLDGVSVATRVKRLSIAQLKRQRKTESISTPVRYLWCNRIFCDDPGLPWRQSRKLGIFQGLPDAQLVGLVKHRHTQGDIAGGQTAVPE